MEADKPNRQKCQKCKSKRLVEDFINKNKTMKTCNICRTRDKLYRIENDESIKKYQKLYRDRIKNVL